MDCERVSLIITAVAAGITCLHCRGSMVVDKVAVTVFVWHTNLGFTLLCVCVCVCKEEKREVVFKVLLKESDKSIVNFKGKH